jgi:hypothetical protein
LFDEHNFILSLSFSVMRRGCRPHAPDPEGAAADFDLIGLEFKFPTIISKGQAMQNTNRRVFMMQVAAASTVVLASQARAQTMVNEKDPQAVALGYVADTTKADAKKFPKHAAAQKCLNCQLYSGKPADASGGCPLFAGKQVAGNGWCSAYIKKAG